MQLRPPTRCCSQSHAPPRRSSLAALHSRPADVLPMQLQARCIHCHRRRCEAAAAARELTAAASGSTSEPARPTQRRVGCIHCHRRRPRMSSLQLQVGRRQSQRDRHRSCSQPRRSLVLTFECPPHMSDVLPIQMQVRTIYCHRRRCNSAYRRAAAVSRTHRRVGRRWLPAAYVLPLQMTVRVEPVAALARPAQTQAVSSLQRQAGRRQSHQPTAAAPRRSLLQRAGCTTTCGLPSLDLLRQAIASPERHALGSGGSRRSTSGAGCCPRSTRSHRQ